jgi:hypothetical protein
MATTDEVLIAVLTGALLLRAAARPAPRGVVPVAWTCAGASVLAAMVAGHGGG